jgi:FkbM family methyltransferase
VISKTKRRIKELLRNLILVIAKIVNIELLSLAYNQIGILKAKNSYMSGEKYIIHVVLPSLIHDRQNMIIFDVGANFGSYTENLISIFPEATVYAFEPNPKAFNNLKRKSLGTNTKCFQFCLGDSTGIRKIYSYQEQEDSQHSTLYKNVFTDLHKSDHLVEFACEEMSLDIFCKEHRIEFIDFLKIDVEGHEYYVLSGAKNLIEKNRIGIIQFEFNEMNVISRIFLKDFYDLLISYKFYRLDTNQLIPLGLYSSDNEIFKFQNILAISNVLHLVEAE